MSGFLARIIAQVVIVGTSVLSKAFVQALRNAQSGGAGKAAGRMGAAVAGNRMAIDEARQILNLEKGYSRAQVLEQFEKYYTGNDPENGGSFYLQSKIYNAKEALLEDLKENPSEGAESTDSNEQKMQ